MLVNSAMADRRPVDRVKLSWLIHHCAYP